MYGLGCNNYERIMVGPEGWLPTPLPLGTKVEEKQFLLYSQLGLSKCYTPPGRGIY
jgi:hypothetical protein